MNTLLGELKSAGKIKELLSGVPPDKTLNASGIAIVFLDAFYNGGPEQAIIVFRHRDQKLIDPYISVLQGELGPPRWTVGDREVERLLFGTTDPRFAAYRKPLRSTPPSLSNVGEFLKNYILACSDPEALKINPQLARVGGRIHIAHVTPEGFRWQIPPLAIRK
jgi:hypothetical protein